MKKLIIFDCDGVLVNSEIIACRITAEALTKLGFAITTEETNRLFTGIDDPTANKIIAEKIGNKQAENFFSSIKGTLHKAFETELKPLMNPILQFISKHGIAHCVASNSKLEHVVKSLELTKQISFFNREHLFTLEQVAKGKPAPDLFLFAASKMGFVPKDCLVIEDSAAGIQAAVAANMEVLGFLGGEHTKYSWYQQRINAYDVPVAYNVEELLAMVQKRVIVQPEIVCL